MYREVEAESVRILDMPSWVEALVGRYRAAVGGGEDDLEAIRKRLQKLIHRLGESDAVELRSSYEMFLSRRIKQKPWEKYSFELKKARESTRDADLLLAPYLTPRGLRIMIKSIERGKEEGYPGESGALLFYVVQVGNTTEGRGIIEQYPAGSVRLKNLGEALQMANRFSSATLSGDGWVHTTLGNVDIVCFVDGIVLAREILWAEGEPQTGAALTDFGEILTNHIESQSQAGSN